VLLLLLLLLEFSPTTTEIHSGRFQIVGENSNNNKSA